MTTESKGTVGGMHPVAKAAVDLLADKQADIFEEASRYTRLRGRLRIGQMYRRRVDHKLFMVRNVYRHEQRVQLEPTDEGQPHTVTFDELRRSYRRLET